MVFVTAGAGFSRFAERAKLVKNKVINSTTLSVEALERMVEDLQAWGHGKGTWHRSIERVWGGES